MDAISGVLIKCFERKRVGNVNRKNLIRLAVVLLVVFFLSGCNGAATLIPPTPYPDEVDWESAVEILNSGDVTMVVQSHSLDVALTMKDGSQIHTTEPTIDDIFTEIEKCGEPCSQIVLATE